MVSGWFYLLFPLSLFPHTHHDDGKDRRQEEKGTTEDEMVGWHHWLNGDEFEYPLGVGDGQGGLVFCGSRGHEETEMTEWLNWTE